MPRLLIAGFAIAGLFAAGAAHAQLSGDANCDGRVDQQDLPALIEQLFIPSGCAGGDANGDGIISAADLSALLTTISAAGPVVTFFGLASASGTLIGPGGISNSGLPIFVRPVGVGFNLVVEAAAGTSGKAPGRVTTVQSGRPDLQIESQNALGNGSFAQCPGRVPAINPPDFGPGSTIDQALQAFACGFEVTTTRAAACTLDAFGNPNWAAAASQTQFCTLIEPLRQFPPGATQLTVQLLDVNGNVGPRQSIVVQVGSVVASTGTPTPMPSSTPPPAATSSATVPPTASQTVQPSSTSAPTQSATPISATATATPTNIPNPTISASPSPSPSATATPTGTVPTQLPISPTPSATRTTTRSATPTSTGTLATLVPFTPTSSPTRTTTRTATTIASFTATASLRATATASASITTARTSTPAATPTSTQTPTRTRTPTATTPFTSTPSQTRTPTPTQTATFTPAVGNGPVVTFFGVASASDLPATPIATATGGIPVYSGGAGYGFSLVIEVRPGPSKFAVGTSMFNTDPTDPTARPDFQIEVSQPLGNGSPAVCDDTPPNPGGVPAINPPNFSVTQMISNALNDLSCRFDNGTGQPGPRSQQNACTLFPDGNFAFVCSTASSPGCTNGASTLQYCGQITRPLEFATGDTLVTVRVQDTHGNPGLPAQLIIRR